MSSVPLTLKKYFEDFLPAGIGAGYSAYRYMQPSEDGHDPAHRGMSMAGGMFLGGLAGAAARPLVSRGVAKATERPLGALAEYLVRGRPSKAFQKTIDSPTASSADKLIAQVAKDRLWVPDAAGVRQGDVLVEEAATKFKDLANPTAAALIGGALTLPATAAGQEIGRAYGEERDPTLQTHWDRFLGRTRGYDRLSAPVRAIMPNVTPTSSNLASHVGLPLAGGAVLAGGLLAARHLDGRSQEGTKSAQAPASGPPDAKAQQVSKAQQEALEADRRRKLLEKMMRASGGA